MKKITAYVFHNILVMGSDTWPSEACESHLAGVVDLLSQVF